MSKIVIIKMYSHSFDTFYSRVLHTIKFMYLIEDIQNQNKHLLVSLINFKNVFSLYRENFL